MIDVDREWVWAHGAPSARIVTAYYRGRYKYRVRRADLTHPWPGSYLGRRWCGSPERAWAAARARLTANRE